MKGLTKYNCDNSTVIFSKCPFYRVEDVEPILNSAQQLKAEIAALANDLESLHVGDFDYGKGEIIIERMRQLSAV